ncbi:CBS domain-containing protein, putative [Babesia ovis]|uniref:CBS domain-containing protein, putative n=1 Tax=Babesia ovis TaxID=5869 RepID=A0A9W5T7J9_BABOV|nr:CBS domain-containing protein, putative [Babesia ovis]
MSAASPSLRGAESPPPSTYTTVIEHSTVPMRPIECRDIEYLLGSTPVKALLHSHGKVLIIDSTVPLYVCLRSMAEYEQEFAIVYDPSSQDYVGCFDEFMFLRLLLVRDLQSLSIPCGDYIKGQEGHLLCRVAEDCPAKDALAIMLHQRSHRIFVWSCTRNAPMGCVTKRCYLGYIAKHLRGCHRHRETKVENIHPLRDHVSVTQTATLHELTNILIDDDEVLLVGNDGRISCIFNRKMVTKYVLSLLHKKVPVKLSTELSSVLNHFDTGHYARPTLPEVDNNSSLIEALPTIFLSSDGFFLAVDSEKDTRRVLCVWDVLQHMLYHLV